MTDTAIIILAAGKAARLGRIKPLLLWNNSTFIQFTIDTAKAAGVAPVVVITGAYAETVTATLDPSAVDIVFNPNWEQGKSSGVVAGMLHLMAQYPAVQNVIIAVCDQPYVTSMLLEQLYQIRQDTQKNMVAAAYEGTVGTPVLFSRKYFEQLLQLKKEEGAKKLLQTNPDDMATVDFPMGGMDIDTEEEYQRLINS